MTRAILARDLKPRDIIKWFGSVMLILTEGIRPIKSETITFQLLWNNKITTLTFWKDVDLVNVYDPTLVDL